MDAMEIIRDAMESEKISQAELGRRLGKTSQNLSSIFKAGNPHISLFTEIINALGYRVVITKDEVNGYEIGGERKYLNGEERDSIWEMLGSLNERLTEVEKIVK